MSVAKRPISARLPYAVDAWLDSAVDAMTEREIEAVWQILRRVARRLGLPRLRVYRTRTKPWAEHQRKG